MDGPAARLAVARLTGTGVVAEAFGPVAGRPLQGYCLVGDDRLTVYLEDGRGQTAVLEGSLVWMEGGGAMAVVVAPWPEVSPDPLATGRPIPEPAPPDKVEVELYATLRSDAADELAPADSEEPAPAPPDESTPGFKLCPEPATLVAASADLNVALSSRHPLAPRAGGTAMLDLRAGRLTIHMRGLPTPAALGRDPVTGRSLNAYRAWLVNQHTDQRLSLGLATRVWGENFRLEFGDALLLQRFDLVLITAEDRTAENLNPDSPQVLGGTYRIQTA